MYKKRVLDWCKIAIILPKKKNESLKFNSEILKRQQKTVFKNQNKIVIVPTVKNSFGSILVYVIYCTYDESKFIYLFFFLVIFIISPLSIPITSKKIKVQ